MTATEIIDGFCLERTIQTSQKKVFPNTYLGRYEADIFELTRSGYLYEYEVKISRADFFAEKKKTGKVEKLKDGSRCNYFYYLVPDGLITADECPDYAGLIYVTGIRSQTVRKMGNFEQDYPDWIEPRLSLKYIKSAPELSKEKVGKQHEYKLLESTYHRYHNNVIRNRYSTKK
jgi:hypothetical protein